jgi:ATP-dependent Clp protease adaptor protein ClpS
MSADNCIVSGPILKVKQICIHFAKKFDLIGEKATLDLCERVAICAQVEKARKMENNWMCMEKCALHRFAPKALEYKRMATKHDTETALERQTREATALYQVALLNDDYTPMEFVVAIIQEYFNKDRETATQIMLSVHRYGKGVCGVFSKDIACTKVEFVLTHARKAGHPLQCVMEEV